MGADSRLTVTYTSTIDFSESISFESYNKLINIQENICMMMWGNLTRLPKVLLRTIFDKKLSFINPFDFANYVQKFLENEKLDNSQGETGFHIGGFDANDNPSLYHVFFGKNIDGTKGEVTDQFKVYNHDHSEYLALYNGRYDITSRIIRFINKISKKVNKYWLSEFSKDDMLVFVSELIKFTSQYHKDVGGNISVAVISPDEGISIERFENVKTTKQVTSLYGYANPLLESEGTSSEAPLPSGEHPADIK